ncbi:MAG: hypothetical protein HUU06_02655 [Planctomycetaceae bacterium]|nr:hypothetical protein [Planctomycetaceae bacterium]
MRRTRASLLLPALLPLLLPALAACASDPDPRVRANAVKALWGWGEVKIGKVAGNLLGGPPREAASACHALGEMVGRTRRERELVERPMLVAALRQAPRYAELRRAASS